MNLEIFNILETYVREFLAKLLCGIVNDLDVGLKRNESGMRFRHLGDLAL